MSLIFIVFQSVFSVFGCILNLLLCHVAYFKSPSLIRTYSIITVNFAITDFLICLVNLLVQIRMVVTGSSLIFVSYGVISLFENAAELGAYLYCILIHLYTHTMWLLCVSFCYRYFVLVHSEPTRRAVLLLLFVVYVPSFVECILLTFEFSEPSVLIQLLREKLPEYTDVIENPSVFGISDTIRWKSLCTLLHVTIISTPIALCILVLRKRIIEKLTNVSGQGATIRQSTRILQLQLLRALTFQASIPVFYLIGVGIYFLSRFEIYRSPALELSIFSVFLLVPVLTPISSFLFVTPYRKWLLRVLRLNQNAVSSEAYGSRGETKVYSLHS